MRPGWTPWFSAALAVLCIAAPARAAQQTTRVFAMQPKLDLAWMDSRQDFHDKLFGLADKSLRGPGKPLIQDGADDFASHLRPDGRNLVLWPEDTGLWAAFTGQRGSAARSSGSLVGAVATLFSAYAPQMAYYGGVYPAVAARTPQVRLLALALTDTFGRVALETFSEMAAKYHVWLEAGAVMAQSWKVVCNTNEHPPQQPCDEQNPAKVQALGDPDEPTRGYAYEATSPDVSNMALVFGPDGKLVSKQVKTYITPVEVGQAEGQLAALDLVPGSITDGLSAVHTPLGSLGFVTSKDAWMPDVLDRLEESGVDLLVQPEFFEGDLASTSGMWAADTLKAAGYSDVQRHPGFAAMALPSAVGNVFDFSADQQTQIAGRVLSKPAPGRWLIGQPPSPGLVGVTPWVVPDPLTPNEPIPARRRRLGEAGQKLAPGSGVKCPDPAKPGPCEGGHVETVLWRDVKLGWPGRAHPQRNAAVAMDGRFAVVAFEEQRPASDRLMVRVSSDGGRHWSRAQDAEPNQVGDQEWPAITVDQRGRMVLAWTIARSGSVGAPASVAGSASAAAAPAAPPRVVFARGHIARRGFAVFSAPRQIDPAAPLNAAQWKPALAPAPGGAVDAAWVDARTTFSDDGLPQAGIYFTQLRPTNVPAPVQRLDTGAASAMAVKMDNSWSPQVAVRSRDVMVSWLGFQNYDWDVFSRLSHSAGAAFGGQIDSNLDPPDIEDLSDSPRPVFTKKRAFIAWTDFHKRDSVKAVHPLYDIYLAAPGKAPVQVDPYGGRQVNTFWPSTCADGNDVIVAFQDSATGVARVRVTRVRAGARRGHAFALSPAAHAAFRPALACSGGRFVAAWEDTRSGAPQIRTAAGGLSQIR